MKDPISVEGLADWLRKQDPDTKYMFLSCSDCLIARYLKSLGLPVSSVGSPMWHDTNGMSHDFPPGMDGVAVAAPRTYGAALKRAEKLLEEQKCLA